MISALLLLVSFSAHSFEANNFSLIFGTVNLTKADNDETYGSVFSIRTEWFVDQDWGMLISGGTFQTESDRMVLGSSEYEYIATYGELGGFLYFMEYFRIAGGLGVASIEETHKTTVNTLKTSFSKIGPFAQVGVKIPLKPIVIGVDYIVQSYDAFSQKGLFFMLGLIF